MGSSQQQDSTKTSTPLAAQMPFLTQGFNTAGNALTQAQGAQAPTNFVAQMTPDQLSNFSHMVGYANGNNTPNVEAGIGGSLAGAGSGGILSALAQMQNFKPQGSVDSTIADAQKYAQNPAISGMVQAAMRDANQEATDITLPGITQGAANSGNINSSRTAIAQGLVQRGLAQKAGDISANLQGQAYNTGLGLAQNQNQFNTNALLTNNQNLGSLGGNATAGGLGALSGSIGDASNLFSLANAGGAGEQAANQTNLDNQLAQYQSATNSPFAGLQNFWNVVGSNNWGGTQTGTQTTQNNPGLAGYLGLGLAGASSLFNPTSGALGKSGFNLFGQGR